MAAKSGQEVETTITYDKEEQLVRLFSAWPRDQRKVEKAGFKPYEGTPEMGFCYKIPLSRFRWRITNGKPSTRGFKAKNTQSTVGNPPKLGA